MKSLAPIVLDRHSVQLWPDNPRVINAKEEEEIRVSLQEFGLASLQTVWSDGQNWYVLGGNQRQLGMDALEAKGEAVPSEIPFIPFYGTRDEALMLNIALNKVGGVFTLEELTIMINDLASRSSIEALTVTGFNADELNAIISRNTEQALKAIGETRPFIMPASPGVDLVKNAMASAGVSDSAAQLMAEMYVEAGRASQAAPKSLHDLQAQFGVPDDHAFWPMIKLKVTEQTFAQFKRVFGALTGTLDSDRFDELLRLAE